MAEYYIDILANRPTTQPDSSPLATGQIYYATDTKEWFVWDGSAWKCTGAAALTGGGEISLHSHAGAGSLPTGLIVMWHGLIANIPSGWALCDGANGTPDLRTRFVQGAAAGVEAGATGGAATHSHAGHAAHAFTQPSDHSAHVFTQPSAHSAHAFTQPSGHSAHAVTQPTAHGTLSHTSAADSTTSGGTAKANANTVHTLTNNHAGSAVDGHSAHAGGAVDAHSAHAGGAVDGHSAHAGGAVDAHSAHDTPESRPPFFAILYIMKL